MKLKGDLDSIGLAELFQTLADQHVTGVLAVTSAMGEKFISIQKGTIAIFSDRLSERTRLGDLLVTRGFVTDSQLQETLRTQREAEPRARLGELLLKKEFIDEPRLKEALKFQLEEEIFDLYTWKGAAFEFDSEKAIADMAPHTSLEAPQLAHLDPQALIAGTSRHLPEWKEIQGRLPTPYLCFKLTPKCEELAARAPRSTQIVVKLLKEGRTIETVVKRSCLGRLAVCKTIIKLLDEGCIFPYPADELRLLASEHRAQKRYADALNIYRRLQDTTQNEIEAVQLRQVIDDTIDSMLRARAAGDTTETVEIFSHKAAAEKYRRRQTLRKVALALFCVVSLGASAYLYLRQHAPKAQLPEAYRKAIAASDTAVAAGKYEDAMTVWRLLYESMDKETETAQLVLDRLKALPRQYDSHVRALMQPFKMLEKNGKLEEAAAGFERLMREHPNSPLTIEMKEALERIAGRRAALDHAELLAGLEARLNAARQLAENKQPTAARARLQDLFAAVPPNAPIRAEIQAELRKLQTLEEHTAALLAKGEELLRQNDGEAALATLSEAAAAWPDSPVGEKARQKGQRLGVRREIATQALKRAEMAELQGDLPLALKLLRDTAREYCEFKAVAGLRKRIDSLAARAAEIEARVDGARAEYARDKARGRKLFAELIREQPGYLVSQRVCVPVLLFSSPEANVSLGGKPVGTTPCEVQLPVAGGVTLVYEHTGYQRYERNVPRLMPDDLEISVRLKREPVCVLELKGNVFAPPRVSGDTLYLLHGNSLSAYAPDGRRLRWSLEKLFDDKVQTRRASSGAGPDELVSDPTWWCPRGAPTPLGDGRLLLPLRSGEVLEIDSRVPGFKRLLTLPCEPVGAPAVDTSPLLGGKTLVTLASSDGRIQLFDIGAGATQGWAHPLDAAAPWPKGTLAAGLAVRPGGMVLALSASGKLAALSEIDGREQWALDLKSPVAEGSFLPAEQRGHLAVIVHTNGAVSAVDVSLHELVWQLPLQRAMNGAVSAIAEGKAVYVATHEGSIRKFLPGDSDATRQGLWQRPLDGSVELPLAFGKLLYAVSSFGTVYAISPEDGHVVWDYRPGKKPTGLSVHGKYVYIVSGNRVLVMNAE